MQVKSTAECSTGVFCNTLEIIDIENLLFGLLLSGRLDRFHCCFIQYSMDDLLSFLRDHRKEFQNIAVFSILEIVLSLQTVQILTKCYIMQHFLHCLPKYLFTDSQLNNGLHQNKIEIQKLLKVSDACFGNVTHLEIIYKDYINRNVHALKNV